MAYRRISFAQNEYYHVYNRGNSKQVIFTTKQEYQRFQYLLYVANGTHPFEFRNIEQDAIFTFSKGSPLVAIGAYCLMPNHFHILLTPLVDNGVQEFVRKLTTSYSMYFNKKHKRTGSLFEGRFKSEHANEDRYLKYLVSYISLNPVKLIQSDWKEKGITDVSAVKKYLDMYPYSSYKDFKEQRHEGVILNRAAFPEYFQNETEFDTELLNWLEYRKSYGGRTSV